MSIELSKNTSNGKITVSDKTGALELAISTLLTSPAGKNFKDVRGVPVESDGVDGITIYYGEEPVAALEMDSEHGVRFINYLEGEEDPEILDLNE